MPSTSAHLPRLLVMRLSVHVGQSRLDGSPTTNKAVVSAAVLELPPEPDAIDGLLEKYSSDVAPVRLTRRTLELEPASLQHLREIDLEFKRLDRRVTQQQLIALALAMALPEDRDGRANEG